MQTMNKDPSAIVDFEIDWSAWLGTDTISSSTWTATGLTIASSTNTTTSATVWLSGGTIGAAYIVTNQIVTVGGRTDQRSLLIHVSDR